ncbi:MAG TPA: TonB-dependent receptor [Kofleriaceae bacterium]|nr:TonB-dependent receptor [Kofleriaceae bacterium]
MQPSRRPSRPPRPPRRPRPPLTGRARLIALLAGALGLAPAVLASRPAAAQGITTGAIAGRVIDKATGEKLAGVTVAATAGRDTATAITEDDGSFRFTDLVPGTYDVTFYYGDLSAVQHGVVVTAQGTSQVFHRFDQSQLKGTTYVIRDHPPVIIFDPIQKVTVDRAIMEGIPTPGQTYLGAATMAADSHGDGTGPAFSGSSGLENEYVVDGVNTTGLRYGTAGSPVLNDFVEQTEVITGGYNAEYGRSTGGVVNVVTRSGSNQTEGSIFATVTPGFLTAATDRSATQATSIDVASDLAVSADVGFFVSGPVVKDKLWYVVGAAPSYSRTTLSRTTKRKVDADQNTVPDVDPSTGFDLYEDIRTRKFHPWSGGLQGIAKLNYAYRPEHQGQLSFVGGPGRGKSFGMYGLPSTTDFDSDSMTYDVAARWTSKFQDNKTELEAVAGWHHDHVGAENTDPAARTRPLELLRFGDLGEWSKLGFEDEQTKLACADGGNDPFPGITNCPDEGAGYRVGGGGTIIDDSEDRWSGRLGVTHRVRAAGTHEIKAGLDAEVNQLTQPRIYTGGVYFENRADTQTVRASRWIQVAPVGSTDAAFDHMCSYKPTGSIADVELPCRFIGQGDPGSTIDGQTVNWAAYLRDSWAPMPNLIIDAGVRYEEQRLQYAKFLRDQIDPNTNQAYGTNALTLQNMWAPRIGVVYDWTREGRSKAFGHWGRFYESIPMDINSRSFGGEVSYQQDFSWSMCGASVPGYGGPSASGCPDVGGGGGEAIGVGGTLVAPGLKAQYLDEGLAGVEYELAEDVKLGVTLQHRSLGRVIEDVSTDGAQTYVIANPGEWGSDEEAKLQGQLDRANAAGDSAEAARLTRLMRLFTGIRAFDPPSRVHDDLQLTLSKRFSRALFLMASYTYSHTHGNFPGLVSYDNGQVDPNISSQYDLVELTANREGPLPQDRPHNLKVDGFYRFELQKAGEITLGWRARLASGTPIGALAPHPLYGEGESFLLPRGSLGRTAMEQSLDLHLGYRRPLAHGMDVEVFADVFNVFDHQGEAGVDEEYSYRTSSNPIVGGTYQDVPFAKALDTSGFETPDPIVRNPDFGNTVSRYAPLSARLGARLTF